jgi:hypothetical protein
MNPRLVSICRCYLVRFLCGPVEKENFQAFRIASDSLDGFLVCPIASRSSRPGRALISLSCIFGITNCSRFECLSSFFLTIKGVRGVASLLGQYWYYTRRCRRREFIRNWTGAEIYSPLLLRHPDRLFVHPPFNFPSLYSPNVVWLPYTA